MQPVLFRDTDKSKTIVHVPVASCEVSPFNPRRTRSDADIDALARRMERNGFEITRALWVYQDGDRYMVFAGGNRLLAVQRTTIDTVPVVLHEGYSDEEIVGLADQDNENDEYHRPVPLVDVWMDYKRLADMGWTQQRIADAKGVSQSIVKFRLAFAEFSPNVLTAFSTNDFLREGHAREIRELVHCTNLTPWLDRETAMLEVVNGVLKDKGQRATAQDFKTKVTSYNAFIEYALTAANNMEQVTLYDDEGAAYTWDSRAAMLEKMAASKARSIQAIKGIEASIRAHISSNLSRYQQRLADQVADAERKRQEAERPRELPYRFIVGRAESVPLIADQSVDVIITSPPYNLGQEEWPMGGAGRTSRAGMGYNKHSDAMPQADYERWQVDVLREMYRVAKPGASFFYNHKVRTNDGRMIHPMQWLLSPDNPWTLRQEIIWNRKSTHNHSATLFWPIDERIYWMTKGQPALRVDSIGLPTIWEEFGPVANTWHPAPFTDKLPRMLLEAIGVDAETVVLDPFMGSGTTLKVALAMGCQAWGVDVSSEYIDEAVAREGWDYAAIH